MRKTVFLPIEVPNNDYCWDGKTPCYYFDNEGGHGKCELNLGTLTTKEYYYKKPKECLCLKEEPK